MTNRPFAYNPSRVPISGTLQVGDLAIGVSNMDYSTQPGGVRWWGGPDESLGYVVCAPFSAGTFSTPDGNIGTVCFWRSDALTDVSYLNLIESLSNGTVTGSTQITDWLTIVGYWSQWIKKNLQVSAGDSHGTFLNNSGQVWTWGYDSKGQLGNNSIISQLTPVSILGNKKTFCAISNGNLFTTGIDKNGQVWGWGYNHVGQLGNNLTVSVSTPVSILGNKKTFCSINSGVFNHTIALDKNNQLWVWGYNGSGELGNNSVISARTPVSVLGNKKTFCQINTSYGVSACIDKNGLMWCWGYNLLGQLGNNTATNASTPVSILGNKKTFCQTAGGQKFRIAIDKNGLVWGWGYNNQGQLGNNYGYGCNFTPVSILGAKKTFCNISAGQKHSIGIDKNGQVWGWGYNNSGQLGINSITNVSTPVSILGAKKTFCFISAGDFFTLAIDKNDHIWSWGYNNYGQLGVNANGALILSVSIPLAILGAKKTFCSISAELYHTIGIDNSGRVFGWGYNKYGQLGDNSIVNKHTPVSILGLGIKTFCQISSGQRNSIGIDDNGQVWGWGYNAHGVLGDNTTVSKSTPVSILGNKKTFCKISSGQNFTIGIDKNGQVWGWGYNGRGNLATSDTTERHTPVSIFGLNKTFCSISVGETHAIGIDKNGQIFGWGDNGIGQLGDNTIISKKTPVSLLGNKKTFCKIATGRHHTMGLDKNGQVWGWGYNVFAQLGDNTQISRLTPVSILGAKKTFCNISSGYLHTIGIDKNGQIWSWGSNDKGQLGINSTVCKSTPVSILGTKKTFCKIAGGYSHTIGIDNVGRVWGWGYNLYGQLGTDINTNTPVRVCNF